MFHEEHVWDITNPQPAMVRDTIDVEWISLENHGRNVTSARAYDSYNEDLDNYFNLYDSYLEMDYTIQVGGAAPSATTAELSSSSTGIVDIDKVAALVGNGWAAFQNVEFYLGKNRMHDIDRPGRVSHMKMLLEHDKDHISTVGLNSQQYLDTVSDGGVPVVGADDGAGARDASDTRYDKLYSSASYLKRLLEANAGQQKAILLLREVFPFCTLRRIIKGSRFQFKGKLISDVNEAIYGQVGNSVVTLTIDRLQLRVPIYKPTLAIADMVESQILEQVKSGKPVTHKLKNFQYYFKDFKQGDGPMSHQLSHKQNLPIKVIACFGLTSRMTNAGLNTYEYDMCATANVAALTSVELRHNGRSVPRIRYDPNGEGASRVLEDMRKAMNVDEEASLMVNQSNWSTLFPVFVFDLSDMESAALESVTQSTLSLNWTTSGCDADYTLHYFVESFMTASLDYSGKELTAIASV